MAQPGLEFVGERIIARADPLPTLTTTELDLPALTDAANAFTTPPMFIPTADDNPYVVRANNLSGTVFIAVGAIVSFVILAFVLYHFIVSFAALRMAKRSVASGQRLQEKYKVNNHAAYGASSALLPFSSEYSKLPFLQQTRSTAGTGSVFGTSDSQTLYGSEVGNVSKQDLTKMFISPTAEVMQHKRARSSTFGAWGPPILSNTSQFNSSGSGSAVGSTSNLHSALNASNRASNVPASSLMHSSGRDDSDESSLRLPSLLGGSGVGLPTVESRTGALGWSGRGTIPSVYLEDLMGEDATRNV